MVLWEVEMKYWSKSTLSIYKYLSTMSNSIDKIIIDNSKNSNSVMLQKSQTTHCQATKILDLIDRKRKIVNLKVIVDDVVSRLNKTDRRIITLVFFDGVKSEVASQLMGISLRTFFRRKVKALQQFALILEAIGYDEEFFEQEYFNEKWFMSVYDNCVTREANADEQLNKYLVKCMFSEISKVSAKFNTYLV